jgi:hypothetical protein
MSLPSNTIGPDDPGALFLCVHGLKGPTDAVGAPARAHFDKHQNPALAGDIVNLAGWRADVALQNPVAAFRNNRTLPVRPTVPMSAYRHDERKNAMAKCSL